MKHGVKVIIARLTFPHLCSDNLGITAVEKEGHGEDWRWNLKA
jgi:hypothetical protein